MRVAKLYIIGLCDNRSGEVLGSAKALFERYKNRTDHKPSRIELIILDGDSAAYKAGKQVNQQSKLSDAMVKQECKIWKEGSESESNDNTASGMEGKSEVSMSKSDARINESVKGRVGVYFIAHGSIDAMYSNTKPASAANVIVWATGEDDAKAIDKLVLLACHTGRVEPIGSSDWKGFVVTLCKVLAGTAKSDLQQNFSYKDVKCTPKVAGWDAVVSVYFDGASANFTPANASKDAVGRKVLEGGEWGADKFVRKSPFRIANGSLQRLDAKGWSDKI